MIVLAAFVARGGLRLEPTTRVVIGAHARRRGRLRRRGAACVRARARRAVRRPSLLAFGLLAAFTALSIVWSLAPADSWLEANRTLAYLAVFAAGIALVRLVPGRGRRCSTASLSAPCRSAPGRC